jgi:hypothetical protein
MVIFDFLWLKFKHTTFFTIEMLTCGKLQIEHMASRGLT